MERLHLPTLGHTEGICEREEAGWRAALQQHSRLFSRPDSRKLRDSDEVGALSSFPPCMEPYPVPGTMLSVIQGYKEYDPEMLAWQQGAEHRVMGLPGGKVGARSKQNQAGER